MNDRTAKTFGITIWLIMSVVLFSCGNSKETETVTREMDVTATAYNSVPSQTDSVNPAITAWGDTLKPGMKAIAVSRDLIDSGLVHKTSVKIEGLEGNYAVLDKMPPQWQKRIDIYMGENREAAINWGKKKVTISYELPVKKEKDKKNRLKK